MPGLSPPHTALPVLGASYYSSPPLAYTFPNLFPTNAADESTLQGSRSFCLSVWNVFCGAIFLWISACFTLVAKRCSQWKPRESSFVETPSRLLTFFHQQKIIGFPLSGKKTVGLGSFDLFAQWWWQHHQSMEKKTKIRHRGPYHLIFNPVSLLRLTSLDLLISRTCSYRAVGSPQHKASLICTLSWHSG